ncbi:MAG: Yip1 family protein [Burkholderiaceae bacterium]|jgi:hypothetical protein
MELIERVKKIVLTPKTEWQVIAPEATTPAALYRGYIVPLALIGPVAQCIGFSLFGYPVVLGVNLRPSVFFALSQAIVSYVLILVGVFLISLIVNALAPQFAGEKNPIQALKTVAYAFTPAWVAGILYLIPSLSILVLLASLYSLYVLFLGLPILMKSPQEKAPLYTLAVVVCAFVVMMVISVVAAAVGGLGSGAPRVVGGLGAASLASREGNPGSPQLNQMSAQIEAAALQMKAAQRSGDTQAQAQAATSAVAAVVAGGAAHIDPVDQSVLKALLPETAAGLPRTSSEATKGGVAGLQVAKAEARYADAQGSNVDLTITDVGGAQMLAMAAAWASIEEDKQTDTGYEKIGKVDGRPVHETFNKNGPASSYETLVAGRFLVQGSGTKIDMDTLKKAVSTIDLARLDAMKDVGVAKAN